jgi:hypothetical protein
MSARSTGTTRPSDAGAAKCPRQRRADADPCASRRRARATRPRKRPRTSITASPSSTSSPASRPRPSPTRRAYTQVCSASRSLAEGAEDDKIVGITAAMPGGTGIDMFGQGVSDPHLRCRHRRAACGDLRRRSWRAMGMKPFCAIYSTFLQRGYDQVVHDVAIQNLPVRFPIDRAGLWAPTAPPMPARSTSPIWAACRASWSWRRATRPNSSSHGAHRCGL